MQNIAKIYFWWHFEESWYSFWQDGTYLGKIS